MKTRYELCFLCKNCIFLFLFMMPALFLYYLIFKLHLAGLEFLSLWNYITHFLFL